MSKTMAEHARAYRARKAEKMARMEAALREAQRLLQIVDRAVGKMRLYDEGANLGLAHEVRMLALNFSDAETPKTPSHTILTGNGAYRNWLDAI